LRSPTLPRACQADPGADDVRLGNRDWFVSGAVAGLYGRYVTGPYRLSELDGA
jgi:hypothetical protein